jgi:hypothetical protein
MTTAAAQAEQPLSVDRSACLAVLSRQASDDEPADLFVRSTPTMIKSSSNDSSNEVRRRGRMNGTTTAVIRWGCGVNLEWHCYALPFRALHTKPTSPEPQEGKEAAPPIRKDPAAASYGCLADAERRTHRDDVVKGGEERHNAFENPNTTVATYV